MKPTDVLPRKVLADASPLIALAKISSFGLLHQTFGRIVVTEAVHREATIKRDAAAAALEAGVQVGWISVVPAEEPLPTLTTLGLGEATTLTHAIKNGADMLMDDRTARSCATKHGILPIGVLVVLLLAKRRHLVKAVVPLIEQLQAANFRISQELVRSILVAAGEEA